MMRCLASLRIVLIKVMFTWLGMSLDAATRRKRGKAMVKMGKQGWPRLIILSRLLPLAMMAAGGCGNPGEGTVTVSPEARARLRGGLSPTATKADAKKPGPVNIKEKMRRKTEG